MTLVKPIKESARQAFPNLYANVSIIIAAGAFLAMILLLGHDDREEDKVEYLYLLSALAETLGAILVLTITAVLVVAQISTGYSSSFFKRVTATWALWYIVPFAVAIATPLLLLNGPFYLLSAQLTVWWGVVCIVLLVQFFYSLKRRADVEIYVEELKNGVHSSRDADIDSLREISRHSATRGNQATTMFATRALIIVAENPLHARNAISAVSEIAQLLVASGQVHSWIVKDITSYVVDEQAKSQRTAVSYAIGELNKLLSNKMTSIDEHEMEIVANLASAIGQLSQDETAVEVDEFLSLVISTTNYAITRENDQLIEEVVTKMEEMQSQLTAETTPITFLDSLQTMWSEISASVLSAGVDHGRYAQLLEIALNFIGRLLTESIRLNKEELAISTARSISKIQSVATSQSVDLSVQINRIFGRARAQITMVVELSRMEGMESEDLLTPQAIKVLATYIR